MWSARRVVIIDDTVWPEDIADNLTGTVQAAGANTVDVVGLSQDDTRLIIVEAKGGGSTLSTSGREIGKDAAGVSIRAAQGSTDYLNSLLTEDKNLQALWRERPDIVEGLKNHTITIEYDLVTAPGDGTSTITNLIIDPSKLDLGAIGGG